LLTPPGTVQAYVTPVLGVAVAVSVTLGDAQEMLGLLSVTVGTLLLAVTVVVAVPVQPVAVTVTVTV
jgi:hypothetical protein